MKRGWAVLAVGLGAGGGLALVAWVLLPATAPAPSTITVAPGSTVGAIADSLAERGHLRSARAFTWLARLRGTDRQLKAGTYEIARRRSVLALVRLLEDGVVELRPVTIPEGLWVTEVAGLLQAQAEVDSAAFVTLARDSTLAARLGVPSVNLEGYLFPDTYDVPVGETASGLVERLVRVSLDHLESLYAKAPAPPLTPAEVMVLASIVEAEARVDEERPRIAAVYLKRLELGWKLEADPTVVYALGERRRRLYYRDLEVESPWNTYRHAGLPPTPIGNPGAASIAAVLRPDPTNEALFFVAEPSGRHRFSRTLAEHQRAIREIRGGR